MLGIFSSACCRTYRPRRFGQIYPLLAQLPITTGANATRTPGRKHIQHASIQQPGTLRSTPLSPEELELLQYILTRKHETKDPAKPSEPSPSEPSPPETSEPQTTLLRPEALAPELTNSLIDPSDRILYLQQLIGDAMISKKTHGSEWRSHAAVALLPGIVFSELLRSLDPLTTLSKELDSTAGLHVGPGMATETPIGQEFDIWGVRKVYATMAKRLFAAVELRIEAGHRLPSSDYQVLLRAAGAASDYKSVKLIWALLVQQRMPLHGGLYHDFLRARFLTEPLYTQYNMEWLRVRPLSVVTQKNGFRPNPRNVTKLSREVRRRVRRQSERFGQSRSNTKTVNYLYRNMRKRMPPLRLFNHVVDKIYPLEERVISTLIIAFGRAASMWFVEKMILRKYWNIEVKRSRTTSFQIVPGKAYNFTPDDPMRPTKRLIEAVIECYGCNSEIVGAATAALTISHRYDITMTEDLWFKLLGWAYVAGTNVSREEWTTLSMADRILKKGTLESIWHTMTSEPYNIKPGFTQHCLLITTMIRQRQYREAIAAMIDLEPTYRRIQAELEESFYKEAMTRALGVNCHKTRKAWSDALVHKYAAWYQFQRMCRSLMMNTRYPENASATPDHEFTTELMPQFIGRFRDLMPRVVKYQGMTGVIRLVHVQPVNRMWWTKVWREKPGIATADLLKFKPLSEVQRKRLRNRPLAHVSQSHPRGVDMDVFLSVKSFDRPKRLQREFL